MWKDGKRCVFGGVASYCQFRSPRHCSCKHFHPKRSKGNNVCRLLPSLGDAQRKAQSMTSEVIGNINVADEQLMFVGADCQTEVVLVVWIKTKLRYI